jgi:hypothetical protein
VYRLVERLVAARAIDTVLVGQRVLSRREIHRILSAARVREEDRSIRDELSFYLAQYDTAVANRAFVGLDATAADSPPRGIAPDANGAIDVVLDPLLGNQLGRATANGATIAATLGGETMIRPWLAMGASARVAQLNDRSGANATSRQVQTLYVRGVWRNISAEIGRDYVMLGQGVEAGLTNSINPRGLDLVRVGTEHPFVMPSILRLFGPSEATAYLADMGRHQLFAHTHLFGYKLSTRPHRLFELGATVADEVGGAGSPGGTFLQKLTDAFPLLDATILHRNFLFSNKFVGMDMRLTVPKVRGAQLYMEGVFDDFDARRLRSVFTEDAGYVWGASQSCFSSCGAIRVSAEYHVTGLRYYTHGIFRTGYTVDGQIVGDQLGPRGRSVQMFIDGLSGGNAWQLAFAHDIRSGDEYGAASTTSNDQDFHFIKLAQRPAERRWRVVASANRVVSSSASLNARIGAERVDNFAHVQGAWRTNWLTQVGVELHQSERR